MKVKAGRSEGRQASSNKGAAGSLSTTSARADIYVFFFDQTGLMAGLGVQGTKISKIKP